MTEGEWQAQRALWDMQQRQLGQVVDFLEHALSEQRSVSIGDVDGPAIVLSVWLVRQLTGLLHVERIGICAQLRHAVKPTEPPRRWADPHEHQEDLAAETYRRADRGDGAETEARL